MESLSNARRGETCTIKGMIGSPERLAWMDELHMRPGSQVTVIQNTMGSLIVGVDGRRLAVSRDAADQIKYCDKILTIQLDGANLKCSWKR